MNREQKAAAIADIAASIEGAQAILAVDYRGISVPQVAELRGGLRDADTTFRVVKNSLTERAADQSGAELLKPLLVGPTALAFVRGDVASAAKAIADYGRATQLLPFKGGLMDGAALDVEQIRALSRLPSRQVLYAQLVGVVSSPVTGLVRSMGALLGGLAVALGQVRDQLAEREGSEGATAASAGEPPPEAKQAEAPEPQPEEDASAEPAADAPEPAQDAPEPAPEAPEAAEDAPEAAGPEPETSEADSVEAELPPAAEASEPAAEHDVAAAGEAAPQDVGGSETEPAEALAQQDDGEADPAGAEQAPAAEEKPAKED